MKCCPSLAGSSIILKVHPLGPRNIAATTSTWPVLRSMSNLATSQEVVSSRTCNFPFATSSSCPPLKAATTKTRRATDSGILEVITQTISSMPLAAPVVSSPECVTLPTAFKLL